MAYSDCIVDSSVFVAFYREIDSQHAAAEIIMAETVGRTIIVHPYVIQETATVLTRKVGFESAKRFLLDIGSSANVIIPAVDVRRDIGVFIEAEQHISFTDIALVSFAKQTSAELITFDKQMLALLK